MPTPPNAGQARAAGWWVGVLVVALGVMATAFGRPPTVSEAGPPGYLPPDGFRVRYSGPAGALATEWAIDQAAQLVNPGPTHFGYWLAKAGLSFTDTVAARQTTVFTNSAGVVVNREDTFMTLGPDGVGTGVEARSWTDSRFYFPARLDLPTSLAAGKSWVSEGTAQVVGKDGGSQDTTYRAQYQATAPTTGDEQVRRCIHITMTLQVGAVNEPAQTRTWCPRLGVITLAESDATWQATTDNLTIAAPKPTAFDWAAVDRLSFTSHTINQAAVPGSLLASPISPPALLSDGTVVAVQKQFHDTVGLSTTAEPMSSLWRARPGGTSTSTATFGDLTVVATSNRQLVAYDGYGRWLWQATLPDQAVTAPVRVDDLVVTATVDGGITAVKLTDGSPAWSGRVDDSVRLQPQVLGDQVVIADLSNHLTCFGADGTQRWSREIPGANNLVIEPGTTPMVVVGGSRQATALALTDGAELWRTSLPMSFATMVALNGVVAVRDGNLTVGLDAATGQLLWRWDQSRTIGALGGGDRLLLLTADRLVALDAHGSEVKQWPLPLASLGVVPVMASTGADRLLLWGGTGVILGVIS